MIKRVRRGDASSFAQAAGVPNESSPEPGQEPDAALEYWDEGYPQDQAGS